MDADVGPGELGPVPRAWSARSSGVSEPRSEPLGPPTTRQDLSCCPPSALPQAASHVHDAVSHPGHDATASLPPWLLLPLSCITGRPRVPGQKPLSDPCSPHHSMVACAPLSPYSLSWRKAASLPPVLECGGAGGGAVPRESPGPSERCPFSSRHMSPLLGRGRWSRFQQKGNTLLERQSPPPGTHCP